MSVIKHSFVAPYFVADRFQVGQNQSRSSRIQFHGSSSNWKVGYMMPISQVRISSYHCNGWSTVHTTKDGTEGNALLMMNGAPKETLVDNRSCNSNCRSFFFSQWWIKEFRWLNVFPTIFPIAKREYSGTNCWMNIRKYSPINKLPVIAPSTLTSVQANIRKLFPEMPWKSAWTRMADLELGCNW